MTSSIFVCSECKAIEEDRSNVISCAECGVDRKYNCTLLETASVCSLRRQCALLAKPTCSAKLVHSIFGWQLPAT